MVGLIAYVIQALAVVAWLLVLGRVLASWLDPTFGRPISQLIFSLTEPFLEPIRRVLPRTGQLDLSPLVALLVLTVVTRVALAL